MVRLHSAAARAAALTLLGLAMPGQRAGAQQAPRLSLTPCTLPGVPASANARCGTLPVYENRATKGRRIELRVVVLPATGPNREPDPIFFIAGGPGSSVPGNSSLSAV